MSYVANPDFNEKSIYRDESWDEIFPEKGKEIEEIARGLALPHVKTGDFLDHTHGKFSRANNGHPYYRVENDDPAALSIEFGTAKMQGQHVLGRAIDIAGEE